MGDQRGVMQLKRNPTLLIPLLFPVLLRGWWLSLDPAEVTTFS